MRQLISACMVLIFSSLLLQPAWALLPIGLTVEDDVRIEEANYRLIFGERRFFPGQKVTVRVSGSVDSDHHYWEERRCGFAGIKCWYEYPESANIVDTSLLPVLLSVVDSKGGYLDALNSTLQPEISNSSTKHIPLPTPWVANQSFELQLEIPHSDNRWDAFGQMIQIHARIADRGKNNMPVFRNRCIGRPDHCGSGAYRISVINLDNSRRLELLEKLLASQVSPSQVIPILKQDRLFISDSTGGHQTKIADLLFKQSSKYHKEKDAELEYLQYALELDRSSDASIGISNALSKAHLKSGNIQAAKLENEQTFEAVERRYNDPNVRRSFTLFSQYCEALKYAAQIGSLERAGIYSGDLLKAVSVYVKASEIGKTGLADLGDSMTEQEWNSLVRATYESLVDASRLLMMMRSHENMKQAEVLLQNAVNLASSLR